MRSSTGWRPPHAAAATAIAAALVLVPLGPIGWAASQGRVKQAKPPEPVEPRRVEPRRVERRRSPVVRQEVVTSPARSLSRSAGAAAAAGSSCSAVSLCASEVAGIVARAASAVATPTLTVAVADRAGNILALFRKPGASPASDDVAAGLARTAAFFSNDQAPLSSRTIRYISGIHFPPGILHTPNAALYGIENTNRGCDLNVAFRPGRELPRPRSIAGILGDLPCDSDSRAGCGPGIVTGKADPFDSDPSAVNPGGVPIFRPRTPLDPADDPPTGPLSRAVLLGGIGVAGASPAEAEFAAFEGAFGGSPTAPVPQFPLPPPGNVFVDGVRLPFVDQVSRPPGSAAGASAGAFLIPPRDGRAAPDGYLAGPRAGRFLSAAEVDEIVRQAVAGAERTRAVIRLPRGSRARMVFAVADVDGELLAIFRMRDATVFSVDVAASKARNVVYFSQSPNAPADLVGVPAGTAVTNRTISFGAQPLYPPGIDGTAPGPFFDLFLADSRRPCRQGSEPRNANQSGVVFFPGSIPLYLGGDLVGGLGVSGDGVEQDDYVAFLGARGFRPPRAFRANRVFVRGVRLPFLKFPRNPEG